jgi:hypothetical protein
MIKIEVTGNSIPEVADKLLAIGASLQKTAQPAFNWFDAEPEHSPVTPNEHAQDFIRKLSAQIGAEVAEAAPVDPTSAPKSAPVAEVSESPPTTTEASSTRAPAASASELSFETDVTPVVLAVVQTKGKPVVEEILSQFGVARASQLDPARWPELVAALKDKL